MMCASKDENKKKKPHHSKGRTKDDKEKAKEIDPFTKMRKWFPKDPLFGSAIVGQRAKKITMSQSKNISKDRSVDANTKELSKGNGPSRVVYPKRGHIEGILVDGKFEGFGKLTKLNTETFTGMFSNNFGLGYGRYKYCDGTIQWGRFSSDKLVGLMREKKLDGTEYIGYVKNGKKHGIGIVKLSSGHIYFGEFKLGEMTGFGFYLDDDGRLYEGGMVEGSFKGYGYLSLPNGEYYVGNFDNNSLEGRGMWTYENGSTYEGIFNNNSMEGPGVLHDAIRKASYRVVCTDGDIKWRDTHKLVLAERKKIRYPKRPIVLKDVDRSNLPKAARKIFRISKQYQNLNEAIEDAKNTAL